MPLTHEQVQVLKERRPGWGQAWALLCADLIPVLDSTSHRIGIDWRPDGTREDFVADTLLKYHQKASRGILLTGYTCACTDPADQRCGVRVVGYLTGHDVLHWRALDFLADPRNRPLPLLQVPEDLGRGSSPIIGSCVASNGPSDDLLKRIQVEIERLTLALPTGPELPRHVETAGIELYPRLDWPKLGRLEEALKTRIPVLPGSQGDCFDRLRRLHASAQQRFDSSIGAVADRIHALGPRTVMKTEEKLRRRMDYLEFHRVFMPLSAADLVQLLAISEEDAAARRSRFHRALPSLLPGLGTLNDELP